MHSRIFDSLEHKESFQFQPTIETKYEDSKADDCELVGEIHISDTMTGIKDSKALYGITQAGLIFKFKKISSEIQSCTYLNVAFAYMNFKQYNDKEQNKD